MSRPRADVGLFSFLRWWRTSSPTSIQPASEIATAPRTSDVSGGAPGASLAAQHRASTAELWRDAFGVTGEVQPVPAGHAAVIDAARAAVKATNLADRYFPRRPMLMPKLQAAANDPNTSANRLADIISQDPVLAGNVLRLANSVFYRIHPEPVETLQRAVVVCGTDGLRSLAAAALMQPVFRGSAEAHTRFPAILWERCTRASLAAELCARRWCPADRQTAQLLALMTALGPLVIYRIVQDQYRLLPGQPPAAAVFLLLLGEQAEPMARRIAEMWQSSARMLAALDSAFGGDGERSADEGVARLGDSLRAGELLATLSLLLAHQLLTEEECRSRALQAGVPDDLFTAAWERLHRPTSQAQS